MKLKSLLAEHDSGMEYQTKYTVICKACRDIELVGARSRSPHTSESNCRFFIYVYLSYVVP